MDFRRLVQGRRMSRRFDPQRPVDPAVVDRALRAAVRAPSAGWSQGWDFVVLTDENDRRGYWAATARPGPPDAWLRGVSAAPCLIVICSDPQRYLDRYARPDKGWTERDPARWPIPYWDVDAGMAALLALLSAHDDGLSGLFFGIPAERHDAVRETLGIPHGRRLVAVLALGYEPSDGVGGSRGSARLGRRPLSAVAHHGRFGVPWASPRADDDSRGV